TMSASRLTAISGPLAFAAIPVASIRYKLPLGTPDETNSGKLASSPPVLDAAAKAGWKVGKVEANLATSVAAKKYGRAMPAMFTALSAALRSLFGPVEVIGVAPGAMVATNAASTAPASTPRRARE